MGDSGKMSSIASMSNSVSITPATSYSLSNSNSNSDKVTVERQSSVREEQSAAQRQATAKLALRKQLEKTLLQVIKIIFLSLKKKIEL